MGVPALRNWLKTFEIKESYTPHELPSNVQVELEDILYDGIDQLRSDCMLLTFLSVDGTRQLAKPPIVFSSEKVQEFAKDVPSHFQSPVADLGKNVTELFGRRSFPNGFFDSKTEFDLAVREKSFFPVTLKHGTEELVAVICGASFDLNIDRPVQRFQRNRVNAAWCTVQYGISKRLSGQSECLHDAFCHALESLSELRKVESMLEVSAVALKFLHPFGVMALRFVTIDGDQLEELDSANAPLSSAMLMIKKMALEHTDFLEEEYVAIDLMQMKDSRGNGARGGTYIYLDDTTGIGLHIEVDRSDESLHHQILLTSIVERMLWLLHSEWTLKTFLEAKRIVAPKSPPVSIGGFVAR